MLFDARGNGKNIGVENNVFWRKIHLVHQHPISALANADLALKGVGLAFLVKGHDDSGRAIALDQTRLAFEFVQTLFHADGVDNAFALYAAQTRFDHLPLGGINHHWHFGNVRLARHQIEKFDHGRLAVEHGLVHIHINDLRAVLNLLARHGQRVFVLATQNHAGKSFRARDIGTLANINEQAAAVDKNRL